MAFETFPPGLVLHDVELESALQTRGHPAPVLRDRLQFGGPQLIAIDDRYRADDQDLQAAIRANAATSRFLLALMEVNFPQCPGRQLAAAHVSVTLSDNGEPSQTIAHSVLPLVAGAPVEVNQGYDIGPDFKLGPVNVSAGHYQRSSVEHGQQDYVRGSGAFTAHPRWDFTPTKTQKIEGPTRLSLVIQIPRGLTGRLSVGVGAAIGDGLFRKRRVVLDGAPGDAPNDVPL